MVSANISVALYRVVRIASSSASSVSWVAGYITFLVCFSSLLHISKASMRRGMSIQPVGENRTWVGLC